ncbi:hypothetical protein ITI46_02150 [Streptomyces oryzae]|uniref:Uncharacterized protein n=1 Tax=Streptomyces oryzae TaxID=1434886 RepID=A0ABS3X563_9ACTN|nr:hypothetical protein [Streptomyces oryzae]MBO8190519.1 hypothetical protein [Streptomyces oryzae]
METTALRRARRWFWTLTTTAVLAGGTLYQGLRSTAGPGAGVTVLLSSLTLAASTIQAARILNGLTGAPRSRCFATAAGGRAGTGVTAERTTPGRPERTYGL